MYVLHLNPAAPCVFMLYEQYAVRRRGRLRPGASDHFRRHAVEDAIPHLESRERPFYDTWPGTTSRDS